MRLYLPARQAPRLRYQMRDGVAQGGPNV